MSRYLNNIVEQDHRAVKRIVRPMLGFKCFRCARALIAGIETMRMIRKGQMDCLEGHASSAGNEVLFAGFLRANTQDANLLGLAPLLRLEAPQLELADQGSVDVGSEERAPPSRWTPYSRPRMSKRCRFMSCQPNAICRIW